MHNFQEGKKKSAPHNSKNLFFIFTLDKLVVSYLHDYMGATLKIPSKLKP